MKIKAVIFDLDGTLYDNRMLPFYIALHSGKDLSVLLAERCARRKLAGRSFEDSETALRALFDKTASSCNRTRSEVSEWYFDRYMPLQEEMLRKHFVAKSWVAETLASLRAQGLLLCCYSDYGFIAEKLNAIGIDPSCFDLLADAPSEGGFKPCVKAALNIASKLAASPETCLMVGDRNDTDRAGALAVGMKFLYVPKKDTGRIDISKYESFE